MRRLHQMFMRASVQALARLVADRLGGRSFFASFTECAQQYAAAAARLKAVRNSLVLPWAASPWAWPGTGPCCSRPWRTPTTCPASCCAVLCTW